MNKSRKLEDIYKKITEFEKKSPYNFCDRWCERCAHEKQMRCVLYKDKLERKITCIAYGKDENDPEITKAVMEAQYKDIDEKLSECIKKFGIDLDNPVIDEEQLNEENAVQSEDLPPDIQKHIRFVENNPLDKTAKNYCHQAHDFLKETFYSDNSNMPSCCKYDFETFAWYHTLLPAKLHRALCSFHEPVMEDDLSLCDAVAQFDICRKAIKESVTALRNIGGHLPAHASRIKELIILLHNIDSRIAIMLGEI